MAKQIAVMILTAVWLSPLLVQFFRQIKTPLRAFKNIILPLFIFPGIFLLLVFVGLIVTATNRNIYTPYVLQYIRDSFQVYADWLAYWFMLPFLLFALGNMIDLVYPRKDIHGCLPEVLTLLITLAGILWVPAWITSGKIADVLFNRVSLFDPFYSQLRLSALWYKLYALIYSYTARQEFSLIITSLVVWGGFFQGFEYLIRMGGKVKYFRE